MTLADIGLAARVVNWQASHGRNDLPWQSTRDPYRVWLSEIMLQQTQVATVKDYFTRFLQRLPSVEALANASLDEVLGLWSGLGYYSRARNLHRCAVEIVQRCGGEFPGTAAELQALPGIGRSTAAAIASLCFGERVAILDANVRRVVTRVLAFDADLALTANQRRLWESATSLLPSRDLSRSMPGYTQGMMDLGATVCLARNPLCLLCPLADACKGRQRGNPEAYPVVKRTLKRSTQSVWMLWARTRMGAVWLQRRPTPGVWAGLYCMPCFDSREELLAQLRAAYRAKLHDGDAFKHVLTHKDLYLHPVQLVVPQSFEAGVDGRWFDASEWPRLGLPAPIRRLLLQGCGQP